MDIYVQVRLGVHTIFNTKLYMEPEETILLMKKKICENNDNLDEKLLLAVFAGCIMEDSSTIKSFGFSKKAPIMVHMFKKNKEEQPVPPKPISEVDLIRLGVAFRSLSLNSTYRNELIKFRKPEGLTSSIMHNPSLEEDPIAISFLQHPELLVKVTDYEMVKHIAENHPILATIILNIASNVQEDTQNHFALEHLVRPILYNGSDDDMEDMDDSSAASEDSTRAVIRAPVSINFGGITAAQLASAIASVTTLHAQPSTSGASTSTGSTGHVLETPHNVQSQQTDMNIPNQLQIMRDMGLTNEAVNLEALRLSSDLATAVELVLSGFTITNNSSNNV